MSAGLLQLNKNAGVDAVGGNIVITGTGQLALLAGEQIPNTSTITFTGSSTDSIPTQAGLETREYDDILKAFHDDGEHIPWQIFVTARIHAHLRRTQSLSHIQPAVGQRAVDLALFGCRFVHVRAIDCQTAKGKPGCV